MRKYTRQMIIILMIMLLISFSASAWYPSSCFYCDVNAETIINGAKYIDMLIPIDASDEEYTVFNKRTGGLYEISKNSEIVFFNEAGFGSYTFHISTATSEIEPLEFFEDGFSYVVFGGIERGKLAIPSKYAFDEFREKYKRAKFAYLDEQGNVLAVTNEIDIWGDAPECSMIIEISGTEAKCEIDDLKAQKASWGFFFVLAAIVSAFSWLFTSVYGIAVLTAIVLLVWCIILILKRRKKSKRHND